MTECLGQPRGAGQHRGDTRRQPQRFLQLGVGGRPVPVVGGVKPAEPCMRLTRFWVEPDCSLKTAARSLVGLNHGGKSKLRLHGQRPAESHCRCRKTRVEVKRLLEMVGRSFETLPVVAIVSMQSMQVKVVCLRINRRRSEEHTSELQSQSNLVCRLLLEKKKTT